jgi:hypothetical protein
MKAFRDDAFRISGQDDVTVRILKGHARGAGTLSVG